MKILVVDDEKLLVKGIKFNLENEGYQVLTAYDGATAVELARQETLDLIILDLMMPGLSGSEACMQIREFSDVPIIMLTEMCIRDSSVLRRSRRLRRGRQQRCHREERSGRCDSGCRLRYGGDAGQGLDSRFRHRQPEHCQRRGYRRRQARRCRDHDPRFLHHCLRG